MIFGSHRDVNQAQLHAHLILTGLLIMHSKAVEALELSLFLLGIFKAHTTMLTSLPLFIMSMYT